MTDTSAVTCDGTKVAVADEFHVNGEWTVFTGSPSDSLYVRVEELYEVDGEWFAVLQSTGLGPDEVDVPVSKIASGLGDVLARRDYSPHLNG